MTMIGVTIQWNNLSSIINNKNKTKYTSSDEYQHIFRWTFRWIYIPMNIDELCRWDKNILLCITISLSLFLTSNLEEKFKLKGNNWGLSTYCLMNTILYNKQYRPMNLTMNKSMITISMNIRSIVSMNYIDESYDE